MNRMPRHYSNAIAAVGILAVLVATPLFAAEFSADLIRSGDDGEGETVKVYIKGDLRREELTDEDGEVVATIYRTDRGVIWTVSPGDGMYVEIPMMPGATGVLETVDRLDTMGSKRSLGMETLNGFDCEKTQYTYQAQGQGGYLVWYSAALDYPVRMVQQDIAGRTMQALEFTNIKQGTVPASMFEPPEGYEKMTMPGMQMPEMPEGIPEGMIPDFPKMDDEDD